jgi:hypothetical protein
LLGGSLTAYAYSFLYWMQTEARRHDGGRGCPELRLRGDVTGTEDGLARQVVDHEAVSARSRPTTTLGRPRPQIVKITVWVGRGQDTRWSWRSHLPRSIGVCEICVSSCR